MARLSTKVVTVATFALSFLATTEALGSAVNYTGTLCKDYVNYQVWVGTGLNISLIETSLAQQGMTAANLVLLPATCLAPFMEYACSSAFPRVVPGNTSTTPEVRFACKSTCEAATTQCTTILTEFGKGAIAPQCDAAIPGTIQAVPPSGILFQPDGFCNVVKSLTAEAGTGGPASTNNQTMGSCVPPFITDTMEGPGNTTTNENVCMLGCCLPCPAQNSLYRTGAIETGFMATNAVRVLSTIGSFVMMVSYLFLPDKRTHPGAMILYFSTCVFLFSVVVIFPLVDTRGMQCVGPINPSTQQNNLKCAIQGAVLIFASISTTAWVSAIIVNLHLHTVWNSGWFAKRYWFLHILCWGFATAVTATALGTGQVQWEFATMCLISQEKASQIFFYPMAAMIFPAFLIHISTFFHIARISIQAGADSETMTMSTISAGAAAVITHRRHVLMAIRIQWRAAVVAIFSLVCVMFYWLFYFFQLKKIKPQTLKPFILKFALCLKDGVGHNQCADLLAPDLPRYGLMVAAEFLMSVIGTMLVPVFFKRSLIHEWREWFRSLRVLLCGKKRREKDQEQFFTY